MATTSSKAAKARRANGGISKPCGCGRSNWDKAPCRDVHGWRLNFQTEAPGLSRRNYRVALGKGLTRREAKVAAEAARVQLRAGTHPVQVKAAADVEAAPAESMTLRQAGDRWVASRPASTQGGDSAHLNTLCRWRTPEGRLLGELPVAEVTEADVETYVRDFRARWSASSVNKKLAGLRMFGRWCARKGLRPGAFFDPQQQERDSPLRRQRENRRRVRLSAAQDAHLFKALESRPRLWRMAAFAVETGLRLGEMLALEWRDIQPDGIHVRAEVEKSRRGRMVPLNKALMRRALAALEMGRHLPDGTPMPPTARVFGDELGRPIKDFRAAWASALAEAAEAADKAAPGSGEFYRRLHWHDLRHSCACSWVERGVSIHFVSRALGHADIAITAVYVHAADADLKAGFAHAADRYRGRAEQAAPAAQGDPAAPPVM